MFVIRCKILLLRFICLRSHVHQRKRIDTTFMLHLFLSFIAVINVTRCSLPGEFKLQSRVMTDWLVYDIIYFLHAYRRCLHTRALALLNPSNNTIYISFISLRFLFTTGSIKFLYLHNVDQNKSYHESRY